MKLPFVDRIHPQNTKFGTGTVVKNKATGDLKLNDSPAVSLVIGLK